MKEKIINKIKEKNIIEFLFVFSVFFAFIYLITFLIGKFCFNLYLNWGISKTEIFAFSDFFEIIRLGGLKDLSTNSNPGLSVLIGKIFYLITGDLSVPIRNAIAGILYVVPLFFISIFLLFRFLRTKIDYKHILMILFVFLSSFSFLFALERGNIIIISFVSILLFLYFKNSNKRILKELSYFFLAFAGGIKLYPMIFVFILAKDKDWFGIIKTAIYFAIVIFIPFLFLPGGASTFITTYSNIIKYMRDNRIGEYTANTCFDCSIASLFSIITYIFTGNNFIQIYSNTAFSVISNIFSIFALLICIFCIIFSKRKSHMYLACVLAIVLVPHPSILYTSIFFMIPLLIFILEENKITKKNVLIFISIVIFLCPLYFGTLFEEHTHGLAFYVPVKQLFIYVIYIGFLIYSFMLSIGIFKEWNTRRKQNELK